MDYGVDMPISSSPTFRPHKQNLRNLLTSSLSFQLLSLLPHDITLWDLPFQLHFFSSIRFKFEKLLKGTNFSMIQTNNLWIIHFIIYHNYFNHA
ncbi:hypothetical protein GYH30_035493 [Glycine max]|uniref:Uncharacterized protein n=1 Tax=Glycine max TaxID=3847 RepID=A0A0R0GJV3_SOYBN|nr:hypothetical protein GYH30_035493 [Glycine max]